MSNETTDETNTAKDDVLPELLAALSAAGLDLLTLVKSLDLIMSNLHERAPALSAAIRAGGELGRQAGSEMRATISLCGTLATAIARAQVRELSGTRTPH